MIIWLLLTLLLSGCASSTATTWYTTAPPIAVDYPIKLTAWPAVTVTVREGRDFPTMNPYQVTRETLSGSAISVIQQAMQTALGPRMVTDSQLHLQITIRQYNAIFKGTTWTGQTILVADLYEGTTPKQRWAGHAVDVRHNWFGVDTALAAAQESFKNALGNLLQQLAAITPIYQLTPHEPSA